MMQLYKHAGEQPAARNDVATRGIIHLHPETVPREARHLANQVICMIAEYHLTSSARGPSSLSPILPEAATTLLPPIKGYVPGVTFEGTRDVRVLDHVKTLQVAAWLHQLDMSAGGDGMASETLAALPRPSPGVIPGSDDGQPYLSGGCRLHPTRKLVQC